MTSGSRLTADEQAAIDRLYPGASLTEIGRQIGRSRSTVREYLERRDGMTAAAAPRRAGGQAAVAPALSYAHESPPQTLAWQLLEEAVRAECAYCLDGSPPDPVVCNDCPLARCVAAVSRPRE